MASAAVCLFLGRNARKPVSGVSDKVVFKPACSATETSSVGAKSQILSSVAPPRKKNLATIFSQGHVLGP